MLFRSGEEDVKVATENNSMSILSEIQESEKSQALCQESLETPQTNKDEREDLIKDIKSKRNIIGENAVNEIISRIYKKESEHNLTNAQLKMLSKMLSKGV